MKEKHLTPSTIVKELDKYIIGQEKAKRAVAIALRNRWRRHKLPEKMKNEVAPKNIIMIGPTGIGKTEIARRLAQLAEAPFVKVEASKYTEVGYVGRDVESMVRDLVNTSIHMVKMCMVQDVSLKAEQSAEERILDILLPLPQKMSTSEEMDEERLKRAEATRNILREKLRKGEIEERFIEIKAKDRAAPMVEIFTPVGVEQMGMNFQDFFEEMMPAKSRVRKVPVKEARRIILEQESQKLIDKDKMIEEAIWRAENSGIIFIDEIDKITDAGVHGGADVSREGVQRDLLPIVEGTTVNTRYGAVKTDHILFIAAGAFHGSSPSDLIPEFQGRFPIRVELDRLTKEDFECILTKPENALIKQYQALLKTEGIDLVFTAESIKEISSLAYLVNEQTEDIGARRLYTVMEKLLEYVSFHAPQLRTKTFAITDQYVRDTLGEIVQEESLSRYIL